jgi:3-oxoacyl-[acyl-carrier-protein] synthase-3
MPKSTEEMVAKLEQITGIKERGYISERGDSVPLMTAACENALAEWGKDKNLIDGIIVAHNAGNMLEGRDGFHTVPNMAALLKNKLAIANHECFAYDLLFGCPGWLQGIIQAHQAIQMGDAKNVLVVGLEVASRLMDPHDLDSMILADGCGATIVTSGGGYDSKGIISYATYSHAQEDISCIYLAESYNKELKAPTLFKMNGKDVYKYATVWVPKVIKAALDKAGLTASDVDMFLFHQANGKMLHAFANNLAQMYGLEGLSFEGKIPTTIEFTGNTSVATIPTMLDLIRKHDLGNYEITSGMKVVFASVGAGMHCNAMVYQF